MRVRHRVAHVDEPLQQLAEGDGIVAQAAWPAKSPFHIKAIDCFLETVAADEPHGVERPAVRVAAQPIDGHDAGVLQGAGDLGLQHEPRARIGMIGMTVLNLLQGHLPVQFRVLRHVNVTEAALGMRSQDTKPRAGVAHDPHRTRSLRVVASGTRGQTPQAGVELRIGQRLEFLAQSPNRAERGEALLLIAAVSGHETIQETQQIVALVGPQRPLVDEHLVQRPRLLGHPIVEGPHELPAVDQVVLKSKQSKQ